MEGEYLQLFDTRFRITVQTDQPVLIFFSHTTCGLNNDDHLMQHTSICIRHFLEIKAVLGKIPNSDNHLVKMLYMEVMSAKQCLKEKKANRNFFGFFPHC